MVIALRLANQDHLEGEESENGWDFGQTTAVLLLGVTIQELFHKGHEYFTFEKDLKKYDPQHSISRETKTEGSTSPSPLDVMPV